MGEVRAAHPGPVVQGSWAEAGDPESRSRSAHPHDPHRPGDVGRRARARQWGHVRTAPGDAARQGDRLGDQAEGQHQYRHTGGGDQGQRDARRADPAYERIAPAAEQRLFAKVSDGDLAALGIDETTRRQARALTDAEQLEVVAPYFPQDQREVLEYLAAGFSVEEVWRDVVSVSLAQGGAERRPSGPRALPLGCRYPRREVPAAARHPAG